MLVTGHEGLYGVNDHGQPKQGVEAAKRFLVGIRVGNVELGIPGFEEKLPLFV